MTLLDLKSIWGSIRGVHQGSSPCGSGVDVRSICPPRTDPQRAQTARTAPPSPLPGASTNRPQDATDKGRGGSGRRCLVGVRTAVSTSKRTPGSEDPMSQANARRQKRRQHGAHPWPKCHCAWRRWRTSCRSAPALSKLNHGRKDGHSTKDGLQSHCTPGEAACARWQCMRKAWGRRHNGGCHRRQPRSNLESKCPHVLPCVGS